MAFKKRKNTGWKLRDGRIKDKELCWNVLRDGENGVYDLLNSNISFEEVSEFLYLYFEEIRNVIVEESLGFLVPENIGYFQVTGIKEVAYKLGKIPSKLGKAVVLNNYETDGYVYISWYKFTNNDSIIKKRVGVFQTANLYRWRSSTKLKRLIHKTIVEGNFKHWGKVDNRTELYSKSMR
jgi:hypothetical protein